jgi:L-asparaginase
MKYLTIKIFSTGGTIDKVYFDAESEFTVGEPQIVSVFNDAHVTFSYEIESLMRKDSLDLTDADRKLIYDRVSADPSRHIIVTHGTDTMTRTAELLSDIPDKVIVLTGSMVPARFRATDAMFNIGCAVGAVQSLASGVYIAMNGRIFPAGEVYKDREKRTFEPIS